MAQGNTWDELVSRLAEKALQKGVDWRTLKHLREMVGEPLDTETLEQQTFEAIESAISDMVHNAEWYSDQNHACILRTKKNGRAHETIFASGPSRVQAAKMACQKMIAHDLCNWRDHIKCRLPHGAEALGSYEEEPEEPEEPEPEEPEEPEGLD